MKKLLPIKAAAEMLAIEPDTLRRWIYKRKIGCVRLTNRALRIPLDEVERLISENYRPPIDPKAKVLRMHRIG